MYNAAVECRNKVNSMTRGMKTTLSYTPEFAEACKRYFLALQHLRDATLDHEQSTHEKWQMAHPNMVGCSTEVQGLRTKLLAMRREQGYLLWNLGMYHGLCAHGMRLVHEQYYDFRETKHRYELAAGFYDLMHHDGLSKETDFPYFNRDHLLVLKMIMLAQAKESEFTYILQQQKADWHHQKSISLCQWILNQYILVHRELACVDFAKDSMPGGIHSAEESGDLVKKHMELLNFVQVKVLFYKSLRQYLAAFLPENQKKKKVLRRHAFQHFEELLKISHNGLVNRQVLRDEMKVLMYEITILLGQNKAITEQQQALEQQRLEILAKIAAKKGLTEDSSPKLSHYGLMDYGDLPVTQPPVSVLPAWLLDCSIEDEKKFQEVMKRNLDDATLTREPMVVIQNKWEDGTLAVETPEVREEVALEKRLAAEGDLGLEMESHLPAMDLYHKALPKGQKVHTITATCTINAKNDPIVESQNLSLMLVCDAIGATGSGTGGQTAWVRETLMDIVETCPMLDSGDAVGVVNWHEPKIEAPYKAELWAIDDGGSKKASDALRALEATGSHSITAGIIEACKAIQTSKNAMMSREIYVVTDGFECLPKDQWKNWKLLHELKGMLANQDPEKNAIVVHFFCLGEKADRYLAQAITKACGGDYAACDSANSAVVTAQFKMWVMKHIAEQHSKVATKCKLTVKCPNGVRMRIVNQFTPENAKHTLLGKSSTRAKPAVTSKEALAKSMRASRISVRNGRSFRNGSKKNYDVTVYKNVAGDEIVLDNVDIEMFVLPIQRAWRAHVARREFAMLVDNMMANVADEKEREIKAKRLANIAARQVSHTAAVVAEDDEEFKKSELELDILDFSRGNSVSTTIMFDIHPSVINKTLTLLASCKFQYRDATGGIHTLDHPMLLNCGTTLFNRSSHSWLGRVCVMKTVNSCRLENPATAIYNPGEVFPLQAGDWLDAGDTIHVGEGAFAKLMTVDGSVLHVLENSSIVFQAYSPLESISEFLLNEGVVRMITATDAKMVIECPLIVDDNAANLLVPPAYHCSIMPISMAKISWKGDRLNVNSGHNTCTINYQGRDCEVSTLMQTVARESNFPSMPWAIDPEEYQEWLEVNPNLATMIKVQVNVVRSVASYSLGKVAEKVVRTAKNRKHDNIGVLRARGIVIKDYLAEVRQYLVNSCSQLDPTCLQTFRSLATATRLATVEPICWQPDSAQELQDLTSSLLKERATGHCEMFLTDVQMDAANKQAKIPTRRRDSMNAELNAAEAELKRRQAEVEELFPLWDLDGSGYVEFPELQQVILTWSYSSKRNATRFLQKWEALLSRKLVEAQVDRKSLETLIMTLASDYEADQFNLLIAHARSLLQLMQDLTESNRKARAIWSLFQTWDMEGVGYIDSEELLDLIWACCPWYDTTTPDRLQAFLEEHATEVNQVNDGEGAGHPVMLPGFHAAIAACLPEDCPEPLFHEGIWAIKMELQKSRHAVAADGSWKAELYGSEMHHLITWDLRHIFDGLMPKDIETFLDPAKWPEEDIRNKCVKPILMLAGVKPKGIKSKLVSSGGDWWSALMDEMGDGDHQVFLDFLITFPLMSISRKVAMDVFPLVNDPWFDPNVLLRYSKVMSYFCQWAKLVLKIAMILNKWTFVDPSAKRQIGGQKLDGPTEVFSALDGKSTSEADLAREARLKEKGAVESDGIHNITAEDLTMRPKIPKNPYSKCADDGDGLFDDLQEVRQVSKVAGQRSQLPAIAVPLPPTAYKSQVKIQANPKLQAQLPRRHGALYHPSVSPSRVRPPAAALPGGRTPRGKQDKTLFLDARPATEEKFRDLKQKAEVTPDAARKATNISQFRERGPHEKKRQHVKEVPVGHTGVGSSTPKANQQPMVSPKFFTEPAALAAPTVRTPNFAAPPMPPISPARPGSGPKRPPFNPAAPSPPTTPPHDNGAPRPSLIQSNPPSAVEVNSYLLSLKKMSEVSRWLLDQNLPELVDCFAANGFDDMMDLKLAVSDKEMFERIVERPGHRMKLQRLLMMV